METQVAISQWLEQVAGFLPFGYVFGAGMVSAVNPCGFALLPVYLSLYLGSNDGDFHRKPIFYRILKAFSISLVVTTGFALLFGVVGVMVSAGGSFLMAIMPWIAVVVAGGLIFLGCWILLGKTLTFPLLLNLGGKIGDPREISIFGFFLFGLAFGLTSLGCTLPIFLIVVGGSVVTGNFLESILQFVSYILGMGGVILVLTLGIAVVKEGIVIGAMQKISPYIQKISALLLLGGGGYIMYYWLTSGLIAV